MDGNRVLLVDDEREFVELLAKRLRNRDMDITCVYNGEDALETLREEEYGVVVLDVKMPGIDGITALKEIKNLRPDTEVLLLTGHATLDTAVEGLKFDAFDYLVKPIEIDSLVRKLKEAFDRRSGTGGCGQWPIPPA